MSADGSVWRPVLLLLVGCSGDGGDSFDYQRTSEMSTYCPFQVIFCMAKSVPFVMMIYASVSNAQNKFYQCLQEDLSISAPRCKHTISRSLLLTRTLFVASMTCGKTCSIGSGAGSW